MAMLQPFGQMKTRVDASRSESDVAFFHELMFYGEMVLKLLVAGLVAGIEEERHRQRYQQVHRLVRASGIGEWSACADEMLVGVAAQYFLLEAREVQRDFTQNVDSSQWQYKAVALLHKCVQAVEPNIVEALPFKVSLRRWLGEFSQLRNRTRGHGAVSPHVLSALCPLLEESIDAVAQNARVFSLEWAYLYRNLSGRYRVTPLSHSAADFDAYKKSPPPTTPSNGVYVYYGSPCVVELVESNPDLTDLYLANGNFNDKRFEMLSYLTGQIKLVDSDKYLAPPSELPVSVTQGLSLLDVVGKVFTNLPGPPTEYVRRTALEDELNAALCDDRHPIITLAGRGGIGKTSLTLRVLHDLCQSDRFNAMLWFSARDIDLLPEGAKPVQPRVRTIVEMADEFLRLTGPVDKRKQKGEAEKSLADALNVGVTGPTLFVLDNFETVRNPIETYQWLDTYIRNPNKVLITTRHRDFKGDYEINVGGMSEGEIDELIDGHSVRLGISQFIDREYRQSLFLESDGHPYVVKVLLGEIAKTQKPVPVARIVASRDDILVALFERTYSGMSPVAQRVFLTLSSWRSIVPQMVLEAILLRPENERMDVTQAIEELNRYSFLERIPSSQDGTIFVSVPLTAAIFGQRKLGVSPHKAAILSDRELLQELGAGRRVGTRHGVAPRIERLFRGFAQRISEGKGSLDQYVPMLNMIARSYAPAWLLIARLYGEAGGEGTSARVQAALRSYLEVVHGPAAAPVWLQLADAYRLENDCLGELQAVVEYCQTSDLELTDLSEAANRINNICFQNRITLDREHKQILQQVTDIFRRHESDANATDLSRLAWLYLHLRDNAEASRVVRLGLERDPNNYHLHNLADKLHHEAI
jgi:hypothetical protein